MKSFTLALVALLHVPAIAAAQQDTIVIRAGRVLDGKGGVLTNVALVIQGSKIVRIDRNAPTPPTILATSP